MTEPYVVNFSPAARRALADGLPEKIAAAAYQFINGALREEPYRVGKQLAPPFYPLFSARRGEYRVVYRISEQIRTIEVLAIDHRRSVYRTPTPRSG